MYFSYDDLPPTEMSNFSEIICQKTCTTKEAIIYLILQKLIPLHARDDIRLLLCGIFLLETKVNKVT